MKWSWDGIEWVFEVIDEPLPARRQRTVRVRAGSDDEWNEERRTSKKQGARILDATSGVKYGAGPEPHRPPLPHRGYQRRGFWTRARE